MTEPKFVLGERYEVTGLLGRGGMGEVRRGRDLRLVREIAVKMLRSDLARDPSFQVRFRREAQAAASLNHSAIVALYDTGEDRKGSQAIPYIIMEYVDGTDLGSVLRQSRQLSIEESLRFAADICAALDHSHRNGIVHRDIKPSNIMVTFERSAKVGDFGIARAVSDSAAIPMTASALGTLPYMPPEQIRGDGVDGRSDVYAAGCVLYEMVTGVRPVAGDDTVEILYQHMRGRIRPPSSLRAEMPTGMDDLILTALQKNPASRYQTAGEFRVRVLQELSTFQEQSAARTASTEVPADGKATSRHQNRQANRARTALDRLFRRGFS